MLRWMKREVGAAGQSGLSGSMCAAGCEQVRSQTPKVQKTDKKKLPKGRAYKRLLYNRRFVCPQLLQTFLHPLSHLHLAVADGAATLAGKRGLRRRQEGPQQQQLIKSYTNARVAPPHSTQHAYVFRTVFVDHFICVAVRVVQMKPSAIRYCGLALKSILANA